MTSIEALDQARQSLEQEAARHREAADHYEAEAKRMLGAAESYLSAGEQLVRELGLVGAVIRSERTPEEAIEDIRVPHWASRMLAIGLSDTLAGATNYVETEFFLGPLGRICVEVRRRDGKTPAQVAAGYLDLLGRLLKQNDGRESCLWCDQRLPGHLDGCPALEAESAIKVRTGYLEARDKT